MASMIVQMPFDGPIARPAFFQPRASGCCRSCRSRSRRLSTCLGRGPWWRAWKVLKRACFCPRIPGWRYRTSASLRRVRAIARGASI